jgi:hypothetical protein
MHSCTLEQRMNVSEFLPSRRDNIACLKGLAQPCARQVTGALCAVWALSACTYMAIGGKRFADKSMHRQSHGVTRSAPKCFLNITVHKKNVRMHRYTSQHRRTQLHTHTYMHKSCIHMRTYRVHKRKHTNSQTCTVSDEFILRVLWSVARE